MSYKELDQLGTMAQSFHFQVTPAKNKCSNARASNCVCMTGKVGGDTPGGCFQRAPDCPKEARYCCPKGTVGRPKRYSNVMRSSIQTLPPAQNPGIHAQDVRKRTLICVILVLIRTTLSGQIIVNFHGTRDHPSFKTIF